jgi:acetyl-CoA carboxylase carboxyltransferase component
MADEDPRVLTLRAMRLQARQGGGPERIARQHAKGKLAPRERLDLLLDPGTFNELEPFITHQGDELVALSTPSSAPAASARFPWPAAWRRAWRRKRILRTSS